MKKTIYIFVAVLLAAGCGRQADTSWPECSQSSADIQYADLKLERIQLDSVYTSGDGYSGVYRDDGLYFYDKYFGYLFVFNADGHLKSRALGMGNGPKEIKIKDGLACAASSAGDLCIAGSTLDFQVYDASKDRTAYTMMAFKPDMGRSPENFCNYSYPEEDIQSSYDGRYFHINLDSQHPEFNYFDHTGDYLENSFHIAKIDIKAQNAAVLCQGYPQIYVSEPYKYASFNLVSFTPSDGGFYVNFEADSTIYRCDMDFHALEAFGRAGREVDSDYLSVRSYGDADKYIKNRQEKGSYGKIAVAGGYIFRSYARGAASSVDGLQIYSDGVLIGDVDVPKGFRVAGKIGNRFFSEIFSDPDSGQLSYFAFSL